MIAGQAGRLSIPTIPFRSLISSSFFKQLFHSINFHYIYYNLSSDVDLIALTNFSTPSRIMASGIEIVGLALAILPLLMSAADYYREGLDSLQTLRTKTGDDRILEFYEEVAFEIFLLRNSIKKLVKDLPGFSPEYKRQLVKAVDPRSWSDEALSDALRVRLGDSNYRLFEGTLRRVLESLNALISDSQLFLSSSEMVSLQT